MIEFNAEAHTYRVDGVLRPSVTQALSVVTNFDRVSPEILERARVFGHHVHLATHLFDVGELDESTLDAAIVPYLDQYKRFLFETKFKVLHSEEIVYHGQMRYAGTLDKRGIMKTRAALVDLKSGAVPRSVGLQTAAYQQACIERPRKRYCLQLRARDYRLIECAAASDFSLFISALNVFRFAKKGNPYAEITETKGGTVIRDGADDRAAEWANIN